MPWNRAVAATAAGGVAGLAALAGRYAAGVARADRSWPPEVEARLGGLGEVDEVAILPLVERLAGEGSGLRGEPGVSYLVSAGGRRVLFDSGLSGGRPESALARNARRWASPSPAWTPWSSPTCIPTTSAGCARCAAHLLLRWRAAGTTRDTRARPGRDAAPARGSGDHSGPRVIGPGMAVLPPLPRMLFWTGYVTEQVLVVNVRGFGLVLVSGCGHPRIEQILGVTERVLDVPVRAVVGGLHLPVHAAGTPLVPQAVLGNPHPPWQPVGERDAEHVLAEIEARGPRLVALSGHDSTPWTYDAFARRFGERYRTLRAGEELRISAALMP